MSKRTSSLVLIILTVVSTASYIVFRAQQSAPQETSLRPGALLKVHEGVVRIDGQNGPACVRAYAAGGTVVCLRPGIPPDGSKVVIYDSQFKELRSLSQWGLPSRARVSASGRLVAWTVFRTGDSYLAPNGQFSTTAGAYDLKTGAHYGSLEDFSVTLNGQPYEAVDRNFWGITFTSDDNTFYATMWSGGKTWLMRGDLTKRHLESLRENVECPSLSPDGTRLAYKKRFGDRWRLHLLDLVRNTDIALAETDSVDDQLAWVDNAHVAYAKAHEGQPAIFKLPADGTGQPELVGPGSSPAFLGG